MYINFFSVTLSKKLPIIIKYGENKLNIHCKLYKSLLINVFFLNKNFKEFFDIL